MKSAEIIILNNIQNTDENNKLLQKIPTTPQQTFLLTYAATHFINKGCNISILNKLLQNKNGSTSELILKLKYMKQCIDSKVNLQNKNFHVLTTLLQWMTQLQKISKERAVKLTKSILLPHSDQLQFQFYEQFFVYLNYISGDIQNLFKANTHQWSSQDLLSFLSLSLPKIHYNIIFSDKKSNQKGKQKSPPKDELYLNESLEYFIRTKSNYRNLCRMVLYAVLQLDFKPNQMRQLMEIACRYFLLFWSDQKQIASELFLKVFDKVTDAVKFSLTDQFLLFFKVCQNQEQQLRKRSEWINSLMQKYEFNLVGYKKDDANPFNSLQIKSNFTVDARKTATRSIQVFHQNSIFYLNIQVEDHDISFKVYFVGDFQSKQQVKQIIHEEQKKAGDCRLIFVASKKGIYTIQFDNSYSWINAKQIEFQYVVLSPFNKKKTPNWLTNLYQLNTVWIKKETMKIQEKIKQAKIEAKNQTIQTNNLQEIYSSQKYQSNQLIQQDQLSIEQQQEREEKQNKKEVQEFKGDEVAEKEEQKESSEQKQKKDSKQEPNLQRKTQSQESIVKSEVSLPQQFLGQANLSLIDNIFSLLVNTQEHTYEFQTNLQDRILKRLRSYCQFEQKYQWIVNSEARDWLKRHGFTLLLKGGNNILALADSKSLIKRQPKQKSSKE